MDIARKLALQKAARRWPFMTPIIGVITRGDVSLAEPRLGIKRKISRVDGESVLL